MKIDPAFLVKELESLYPEAKCSLDFNNAFEALVSVALSAQATDKSVNLATPSLFARYPNATEMAKAEPEDLIPYIRSIGLYQNKAKNLVALSRALVKDHNGEVPLDFDTLISLPGVGKKTAGVVLAEIIQRPAMPVDTHITRVSYRLGYTKEGLDAYKIEKKLESIFPMEKWIPLHHRLIAFGRDICHAKKPECGRCPFAMCPYLKKASSTASKKR